MSPSPAVGIDLGTTFSEIAYLDETGKPATIPNSEGELITPSVVFFDEDAIIVGREAKKSALLYPAQVVQWIKRQMGTDYIFCYRGLGFKPENISAMILKKLKQDATARLGEFTDVVITVPAFFDDTRRKATQDAGQIAGLKVIDILNEPSAAALAYGISMMDKPQIVLVYDLGGGTFDVTLVRIGEGKIVMLATDGDVVLGGADWDERIVRYVAEQFQQAYGEDPRTDKQAHQDLLNYAEEQKKALSKRVKVTIPCTHAGHRHNVELTREKFEELTKDLLFRTESTTSLILDEAKLTWNQVDHVLLVGGSCRMPMVKEMLKRITGKEPHDRLPLDEVVAHGAAIYAGVLQGQTVRGATEIGTPKKHVKLVNVNSHSLGIVVRSANTKKPTNVIMIPKNTPLPFSQSRVFQLPEQGVTKIKIPIVEGESSDPEACIQIGKCVIRDLPPNLPKGASVQVMYEYKSDSRIHVYAMDITSGREAVAEIERVTGLSSQEVAEGKKVLANMPVSG